MKDPENPKEYISEFDQYTKDGDTVWVELSRKIPFNAKGEIEIVGLSSNIAERILAFVDAFESMIENTR